MANDTSPHKAPREMSEVATERYAKMTRLPGSGFSTGFPLVSNLSENSLSDELMSSRL